MMIKKTNRLKVLFMSIISIFIASFIQPAVASGNQKSILDEVNAHRQKYHLSPLKMDTFISNEAKKHSQHIADHDIPLGHKNFKQRVNRIFSEFRHSRGVAENVAYAYSGSDDVVKQWLSSSGHRKNIEGNYNLTGIGIASDKEGRIYITQIFLRTH